MKIVVNRDWGGFEIPQELADKLNVTDKAVSIWETGKCYPDIEIIEKLSEIFDVTINELLNGTKLKTNSIKDLESITLKVVDENNKKAN